SPQPLRAPRGRNEGKSEGARSEGRDVRAEEVPLRHGSGEPRGRARGADEDRRTVASAVRYRLSVPRRGRGDRRARRLPLRAAGPARDRGGKWAQIVAA